MAECLVFYNHTSCQQSMSKAHTSSSISAHRCLALISDHVTNNGNLRNRNVSCCTPRVAVRGRNSTTRLCCRVYQSDLYINIILDIGIRSKLPSWLFREINDNREGDFCLVKAIHKWCTNIAPTLSHAYVRIQIYLIHRND